MKNPDPKTTNSAEQGKKPYEKPAILSRENLEAVAVVCTDGGSKGNPGVCPVGPLNS